MSDISKINGFVDKYLFFGFIIIIPALILGPAIPDLIVTTSSILFVLLKAKTIDYPKYKNYIILFLLFYFLIIASSLQSDYRLWSLKSSLFYLRFFLYFFVVSYLIENYFFILKYLFITIFLILAILFIDALFQFIFKVNLIGFPISENGHRIASFFKDEYILGSYILRIFPILLFCLSFFNFEKKYEYIIFVIIFFISGLTIILSGDRTPLLLFIIYIILYFFISNNKKYFLFLFSSFLIIFSLFIFNNSELKKRLVDQTIIELGLTVENPGFFFEKKGLFFFSPQHEKLFKTSINIYRDNKILGVGPNNFRYSCKDLKYKDKSEKYYNCYNHPHNLFVQILAEGGIFVFLLLFIFYLYLVKNYFYFLVRSRSSSSTNLDKNLIFLIISILVNLFPLVPSGNFFNNNLTMFNFLCIALFFSYLKNPNQIKKTFNFF